MIVVDASVILQILLNWDKDAKLKNAIIEAKPLIAPHFSDLEVLNGFRRHLRLGALSENRAVQAIEDLTALNIDRRSVSLLSKEIWALRNNITPYDAAYVVLAADLGLPLLTRDKKLAQEAAAFTKIELI